MEADIIANNQQQLIHIKNIQHEIVSWDGLDKQQLCFLQQVLERENKRIQASIDYASEKQQLYNKMERVAQQIFTTLSQAPDKHIRNNDEFDTFRIDWRTFNELVRLSIFPYSHADNHWEEYASDEQDCIFSATGILQILEDSKEDDYFKTLLNASFRPVYYEEFIVRKEKR